MNDLEDVGLDALERLEAQDELNDSTDSNEDTTSAPEGEEKNNEEAPQTDDSGEDGEESSEEGQEEASEEEAKDSGEEKKDEGETVSKTDENKKELTDEEFEEMAKKRGYVHEKTAEEKQEQLEKLMSRPKEIDEETWGNMDDKNKLIYNALPYLVAEGKRGTYKVKMGEQLPEGFEFKSDKARTTFMTDMQAQEQRASQLKNAIETREAREQAAAQQRAEAQEVVNEINQLQKAGDIPTPKAKYGTKEFDNDPAVLTINKILDYRAQRAAQGVRLSVRDSYLIYKAEHPSEFIKTAAKGDIERSNISKKIAGNSKASSSAVNGDDGNKPRYYKPGMSTEDVLDLALNDLD